MTTRWAGPALAGALLLSPAAFADEITIRAAPAPIVTAQVNGRPARLQIDPMLPDVAVFNPASATRLGVRPTPVLRIRVDLDDASIPGRVASARIVFANGKTARALAGLFSAPYSTVEGVDGAIGPGVLPYDHVRIVLRDGPTGAGARAFALADADIWSVPVPLAGARATLRFNVTRSETVLSRSAGTLLNNAALITPAGDLVPLTYPLGLSTTAQPVRATSLIGGFAFGPTLARTGAPLGSPDGVDVVTVTAHRRKPPAYVVTLGRAALTACSDIEVDRPTRRLTVHCDG